MKLSHLIACSGCLLIFFACRGKPTTRSVTAQGNRDLISSLDSGRKGESPTASPNDPASERFLVEPEIAIMNLSLRVVGNSFLETRDLIDSNTNLIFKAINQTKGCVIAISDYSHPQKTYRKKVLGDQVPFSGSQEMKVTISFAEKTNIQERIRQLNKCMQTIYGLKLDNPDPKKTTVNFSITKPLPTITNANKYRKQLLASKFSGLKEVAAISENPLQFDAKNTECTSNGKVYVTKRSLSKLELDIDFNCQKFGK